MHFKVVSYQHDIADPASLLQPFVNVASNANTRIKPDMVERVACEYYLLPCFILVPSFVIH